jgi:transposase-like protein
MRTVQRIRTKGNGTRLVAAPPGETPTALEARIALIQALIPLGLEAVGEVLQREVIALAGERHARQGRRPGLVWWGQQQGSVYLADQKLPVVVPRVRDRHRQVEVPLESYQDLQQPRAVDEGLFRRVLGGLACREYAACAEAVPTAFGLSASSVSRRFVRASARRLQELQERSLAGERWVALFLDGKTFADDELVIALGVTLQGEKRVLGLVQTATEHQRVCAALLRELVERGFGAEDGLLVVLDGAKGLCAAVAEVFGTVAQVQRCQWHKRENVVRHLPRGEQATWRRKLQAAYGKSTYAPARAALRRLEAQLKLVNLSAAKSLAEGLEETLTLHRLGLFAELGVSFKTTNPLESIMAQVEHRTGKVDHWRTSEQKQRWCAAALLLIELRLRKVKGYRHVPRLAEALRTTNKAQVDVA